MEAVYSSEMLDTKYQTTWCHNSENCVNKESFVFIDTDKPNHIQKQNIHGRSMPEPFRRLAPTPNPYKCYQRTGVSWFRYLVALPSSSDNPWVLWGVYTLTSCGTSYACSASIWTRKSGHIQININYLKIPYNEIYRTDRLPRQEEESLVLRVKELQPGFLAYW